LNGKGFNFAVRKQKMMHMKRFFSALSIFVLVTTAAMGQLRKVPAEVTEALKSKYLEASNVSWTDKLTTFSASFDWNHEKYESRFLSDGTWQQSERQIDKNQLPAQVMDGLEKSKYADWKIKSLFEIEKPREQTEYRILSSRSDLENKNLLFNREGRLLKDNISLRSN
jgi:hypothetical protein